MDDKEEYFLQERIDNLYDILAFCKENGITAVLITTPYTSLYSELFSPEFKEEFYAEVNAIASKAGVPYYDFSDDERFSNRLELFADADHLNAEGAAYFMNVLELEIPEMQTFCSIMNPIDGRSPDIRKGSLTSYPSYLLHASITISTSSSSISGNRGKVTQCAARYSAFGQSPSR